MAGIKALRLVAAATIAFAAHGQQGTPQQATPWRDPSPHKVQFVTVQEGVRLEVLDWGGAGRNIVLLAGSGNTAHVFDEFAPKVAVFAHVYGITRRGFGASSQPPGGYDEPRLAEDILQVLNTLHIPAPILVGHSMAGGEMTVLASRNPDRVGGLVYLDALFDPGDLPASNPAFLDAVEKMPKGPVQPAATREETRSFSAYRARQMRNEGFAFPESELHAGSEETPDGSKGKYKTPQWVFKAIGDGALPRDYSKIQAPILSISEAQKQAGDYASGDQLNAEERKATDTYRNLIAEYGARWNNNLKKGPHTVRFVALPDAGHYLFLTKPADVLRELQAFAARTPGE